MVSARVVRVSAPVIPLRSEPKPPRPKSAPPPRYAELAVISNFSFLRGASDPGELVETAKQLGLAGLGIADRNSVAGVVRAHVMAQEITSREITSREIASREIASQETEGKKSDQPGFQLAVGARLVFSDDTPDILAYPRDRAAWGRLTRLLSFGKRRADKGDCILGLPDLLDHLQGLNLVVMPPSRLHRLDALLDRLRQAAPRRVWLAAGMLYRGDDTRRLARLATLANLHRYFCC